MLVLPWGAQPSRVLSGEGWKTPESCLLHSPIFFPPHLLHPFSPLAQLERVCSLGAKLEQYPEPSPSWRVIPGCKALAVLGTCPTAACRARPRCSPVPRSPSWAILGLSVTSPKPS